MYGEQAEKLEELTIGFQQTLQLLRDLVGGKVELVDLEVKVTGWAIKPKEEHDAVHRFSPTEQEPPG